MPTGKMKKSIFTILLQSTMLLSVIWSGIGRVNWVLGPKLGI